MNPVTHAQTLVKAHGIKKAYEIASGIVRDTELTLGATGCPYFEEVEMVEKQIKAPDGKIKTIETMVVDEAAQAKRVKKTLVFWKNVVGYLAKRKPVEAQAA